MSITLFLSKIETECNLYFYEEIKIRSYHWREYFDTNSATLKIEDATSLCLKFGNFLVLKNKDWWFSYSLSVSLYLPALESFLGSVLGAAPIDAALLLIKHIWLSLVQQKLYY